MTLKEKLSPAGQSFTSQEISEALDIPIPMIDKLKRIGIISPDTLSEDRYTYKTVKFLERYWPAVAYKMLNAN